MKFILLLSLGMLTGSLCCCQTKEVKEHLIVSDGLFETINVEIESNNKTNVNEVFNKVDFIPLETNDDCLIGKIHRFRIYRDRVYIVDKITQTLFIFGINGKYITKICSRGKGPGEYSLIENLSIVNDTIVIGDNDHLKMIFYSLDGKYIAQKKIPFNFRDFTVINGEYYFYCPHNYQENQYKHRILICDGTLKYIGYALGNNEVIETRDANFSNSVDRRLFSYGLNTDIYQIDNSSIRKRYHVDFGEYNYDEKEELTYDDLRSGKLQNKNYALFIDDICENKEILFFEFMYSQFGARLFYHKVKKESKTVFKVDVSEPLGPIIFNHLISVYDDRFVTAVDAYSFVKNKGNLSNITDIKTKNKLNNLLLSLNEDANPILVFYDLNFNVDWNE